MATQIELPKYPHSGHGIVSSLTAQRERYREAIGELRAALAEADEAFTVALAAQDRRTQTQDRIQALAKATRTTGRREAASTVANRR